MANDPKFARVSNTKNSLKKAVEEVSRDSREGEDQGEEIRLNKYISECGIASRRRADELINEGHVVVNGKKVYELGTKVRPLVDRITVSGKPIKPTTHKVYILFNKPKNVVTTMEDPEGRPAISDYFERLPVRVFPVGRLDWDSEGMILLTNDGEFAQKVNHPSEEILKTYMVKVSGHPSQDALDRLRRGVSIVGGGKVAAKGIERIRKGDSDKYDWIKIMISEGKNRQIRKMFEKIGFDVMKLQRVAIGRLRMPTALKRGEYLFLTYAGIEKIFQTDRDTDQEGAKKSGGGAKVSAKREARNDLSRTKGAAKPPRRGGGAPGRAAARARANRSSL
jgi:23S rRNA pseudouridine2605 synthase